MSRPPFSIIENSLFEGDLDGAFLAACMTAWNLNSLRKDILKAKQFISRLEPRPKDEEEDNYLCLPSRCYLAANLPGRCLQAVHSQGWRLQGPVRLYRHPRHQAREADARRPGDDGGPRRAPPGEGEGPAAAADLAGVWACLRGQGWSLRGGD